jgi:hypothetical protein
LIGGENLGWLWGGLAVITSVVGNFPEGLGSNPRTTVQNQARVSCVCAVAGSPVS